MASRDIELNVDAQMDDTKQSGDLRPLTPRQPASWGDLLAEWLTGHAALIALGIIGVGFTIRLSMIDFAYYSVDELMHVEAASETSWAGAYRAGTRHTHPPLIFLAYYGWIRLGDGEWVMRLMTVLLGTAALWAGYKWLEIAVGRAAALMGLIFLTFCAPMIELSTVVRGYMLMLLFMFGSLYFLERFLRDKTVTMVMGFACCLYLAIMTHFSAAWFTLAVGPCVLVRVAGKTLPARIVVAWCISQIGAATLLVWLLVTRVSTLRGGPMEDRAAHGWLRSWYFHPQDESALHFIARTNAQLFEYAAGSPWVATGLIALVIAGLVTILVRGSGRGPTPWERLDFAVLLGAPFLIGTLVALLGVFPYGGSRHSIHLLPFIAGAASVILGRLLSPRWIVAGFVGCSLLGSTWAFSSARAASPRTHPLSERRYVLDVIERLPQLIPEGEVVVIDETTRYIFNHYLKAGAFPRPTDSRGGAPQYDVLNRRFLMWHARTFTSNNIRAAAEDVIAHVPGVESRGLWVVSVGPGQRVGRLSGAETILRPIRVSARRSIGDIEIFHLDPREP